MEFTRIILTISVFLILFKSEAQVGVCAFSTSEYNTIECLTGYVNYNDNINANSVVQDMLLKMKIKNTFFITKICKGINNAIAIKYNNQKYILLDTEWMENLKYGKKDWFHLFVIGHEMSHHLLGHTDNNTVSLAASRKQELEADELSGYIIGAYGITQNEINQIFLNFPENNDKNSTHPNKKDRIAALQKGFNSASKSESNVLLQSLTKNSNFDLNNLPYLLSEARNSWHQYLTSFNNEYLAKAIEYYQQAIRFNDEPQLIYELGGLFLAKGDRNQYNNSLELAYKKTNEYQYLNELIGSLIESTDKETDSYLKKYEIKIKAIDYTKINDPQQLVFKINYFMYKSRINFNEKGIDTMFVNKAIKASLKNINLLNDETLSNERNHDFKGQSFNSLGLCYMWIENYEKSMNYFLKAKEEFDIGEKQDSGGMERMFKYYTMNKLVILGNISLTNIRLRSWEEGLNAVTEYESILKDLPFDKKNYLAQIGAIRLDNLYYYKGRCLHGIGKYEDAVENYTLALKTEEENFLYYFRGISYLGLKKDDMACNDFKKSCELGMNDGCNRFNSTCK